MTPEFKEEIRRSYQTIRSQEPWSFQNSPYQHHRILPFATLAPWLTDQGFKYAFEKAKDYTLVDLYRAHELWTLARQITSVPGDVLEVGVWRGGTGAILASACRGMDKTVYLADTFEGVVKAGENDTSYKGGEHADTSLEIVRGLIDSLKLNNVELLQGVFPDDTADRIRGKIAFLHCDVDVYTSSRDVVQWCLPRLSVGSVLVFDDYGFFGCEGVTKFCDELGRNADFRFIHNLNGHAIFVKFR